MPFIVYHKNKISKPTISDLPFTSADVFSTIVKLIDAHYKPSKTIDGVDIFEMLKNRDSYAERPIFWHYPHYSNQGGKPGSAMRKGNWKLIYNHEDGSLELNN